MMKLAHALIADRRGAAASEMALTLPFLILLLFAALELGYLFMSEHVVQKGVRDAARYASRLPMTAYPACSPTAGATTQIQKVARTGLPAGTNSRLIGWTQDTMTSVNVICDTSGTYTGMFTDFPDGVPTVTVTAQVPHEPLFGLVGFPVPTINLNAQSESAVFGA